MQWSLQYGVPVGAQVEAGVGVGVSAVVAVTVGVGVGVSVGDGAAAKAAALPKMAAARSRTPARMTSGCYARCREQVKSSGLQDACVSTAPPLVSRQVWRVRRVYLRRVGRVRTGRVGRVRLMDERIVIHRRLMAVYRVPGRQAVVRRRSVVCGCAMVRWMVRPRIRRPSEKQPKDHRARSQCQGSPTLSRGLHPRLAHRALPFLAPAMARFWFVCEPLVNYNFALLRRGKSSSGSPGRRRGRLTPANRSHAAASPVRYRHGAERHAWARVRTQPLGVARLRARVAPPSQCPPHGRGFEAQGLAHDDE
jgi:hypothetical protein